MLGECLQHDGHQQRCGLLNQLEVHGSVSQAVRDVLEDGSLAVADRGPEVDGLHAHYGPHTEHTENTKKDQKEYRERREGEHREHIINELLLVVVGRINVEWMWSGCGVDVE